MCNRLLEANGKVKIATIEHSVSTLELVVGADTIESVKSLLNIKQIVVKFKSSADGRGFSMAAAIRDGRGYNGRLIAGGQLNPDQLSLAFQCGFDAVIVENTQWSRYGKDAWMKAMNPNVNRSYLQTYCRGFESIWESRATDL